MPERMEPEEIVHLALEPARGERPPRQRRHGRSVAVEAHLELEATIRCPREEDVDGPERVAVVVGGDQAEPKAFVEQSGRLCLELLGADQPAPADRGRQFAPDDTHLAATTRAAA
jgi:hypothetical protein